jgi:Cytoskeletal-regulatory complex EF hand
MSTYNIKVDFCNYFMANWCCNLAVQLQIDRELMIRSMHRRTVTGVVQMTSPRVQTMHNSGSTADEASRGIPQFNISALENGVYNAWFQAAACSSINQLTPQEARDFLTRSGLPDSTLAYVWHAVEARGSLNYQQFVMACRLVALVQNGTASSMSQEEGRAAIRSAQHVFPQMHGV